MPLKGVPKNISPELMHTLMSMGHGDEIVIADANFPSTSCARRLIRSDGQDGVSLLKSIMKFLPIDRYVDDHCVVMALEPQDSNMGLPPIWKEYEQIVQNAEGSWVKLTSIERQKFYERAKQAFAVVASSESALYANLILKKGVVPPQEQI